jgi:hypothetical protein
MMNSKKLVYKYRIWDNSFHKRLLTHSELYYSSPSDINDPFDFKVSLDFSLLDNPGKREAYVDTLIRDASEILRERKINMSLKKSELLRRLVNDRESIQDEFDLTNYKWTDDRFGVISLSECWDSILMWSHYSNNHKGFSVGINLDKLKQSSLFGVAGPVVYANEFPKIDPLEHGKMSELLAKTFTKAKVWEYEKEYRLAYLWDDRMPTIDERKIILPDGFVDEIILGMCINEKDKQEIVNIAESKQIPVFTIVKKRGVYEIDRRRL